MNNPLDTIGRWRQSFSVKNTAGAAEELEPPVQRHHTWTILQNRGLSSNLASLPFGWDTLQWRKPLQWEAQLLGTEKLLSGRSQNRLGPALSTPSFHRSHSSAEWSDGFEDLEPSAPKPSRQRSSLSLSSLGAMKPVWPQWVQQLPQTLTGLVQRLGRWHQSTLSRLSSFATSPAPSLPLNSFANRRHSEKVQPNRLDWALQRRHSLGGGENLSSLPSKLHSLTPTESSTLAKLQESKKLMSWARTARWKPEAQAASVYAQERAVALFLEAYKIESQKRASQELALPGHFFSFNSARRSQPHPTLQTPYAVSSRSKVERASLSEVGFHLHLDKVPGWEKQVRPSEPSTSFYHEFQSGPFCQTVSVNNYLGVNLFSPELGHLMVEDTDEKSYSSLGLAPSIHEGNRRGVHRRLMQHAVQTAVDWGFDPQMLQLLIAKMDIATHPIRTSSTTLGEAQRQLREAWSGMEASQADRALLTFTPAGRQVGHIVALRRVPGAQRWVLLDGNQPPVELDLKGLLELWIQSPMQVTLQFPQLQSDWNWQNLHQLKLKKGPPALFARELDFRQDWEEAGLKLGILNRVTDTLEDAATESPGGLDGLFSNPLSSHGSEESPQTLMALLRNAGQAFSKIPPFFLQQAQKTQALASQLAAQCGLQDQPDWKRFEQSLLSLQSPGALQEPLVLLRLLGPLLPPEATQPASNLLDRKFLSASSLSFLQAGGAQPALKAKSQFLQTLQKAEQSRELDGWVYLRLKQRVENPARAGGSLRSFDPKRIQESALEAMHQLKLPPQVEARLGAETEAKVMKMLDPLQKSLPMLLVQKSLTCWMLKVKSLLQILNEPNVAAKVRNSLQTGAIHPQEIIEYFKAFAWSEWRRALMSRENTYNFNGKEQLPLGIRTKALIDKFEKKMWPVWTSGSSSHPDAVVYGLEKLKLFSVRTET